MSPACRSRTLTLTAARIGRPASCQAASWATTSRSTRPVSSRITGVGSATRISSSGPTMPALRVPPAQQRLDADHLAGRDGDLRLVVERDAVVGRVAALQRAGAGRRAGPAGPASGAPASRAVDGDLVAALLGVVHRGLGLAQQGGAVAAALGLQRDADRGADVDRQAVQGERPVQRLGQVRRRCRRAAAGAVDPGGQHGELVAAEPHHQIVRRYDRRPAARATSTSSRSPTRVPEGVVDVAEPVEVQQQQREPRSGVRTAAVARSATEACSARRFGSPVSASTRAARSYSPADRTIRCTACRASSTSGTSASPTWAAASTTGPSSSSAPVASSSTPQPPRPAAAGARR